MLIEERAKYSWNVITLLANNCVSLSTVMEFVGFASKNNDMDRKLYPNPILLLQTYFLKLKKIEVTVHFPVKSKYKGYVHTCTFDRQMFAEIMRITYLNLA